MEDQLEVVMQQMAALRQECADLRKMNEDLRRQQLNPTSSNALADTMVELTRAVTEMKRTGGAGGGAAALP